MALSPRLRAALDGQLEGVSRNDLAVRATAISDSYRAGAGSQSIIRDRADALAYAVVRMPATYAALAEALAQVAAHGPDLRPTTLLDLGAGPGTATFAALEAWPTIAAVVEVETNAAFRALAKTLREIGLPGIAVETRASDAASVAFETVDADVVIASYLSIELGEAAAERLVARAFESCRDVLVLVEPGTPAGFARLRAARIQLVAAGAKIIAPCPGEMPCPMTGTDWCHFSVRLARSRDHKLVKVADVPFEDERFCYLAVTRRQPIRPATARVLAEPAIERGGVALKLCTTEGLQTPFVARRDKAAFKHARKLGWGEATAHD